MHIAYIYDVNKEYENIWIQSQDFCSIDKLKDDFGIIWILCPSDDTRMLSLTATSLVGLNTTNS